jgi:hypothetical protein
VAGTFATNAGGSITIAADGSYTYTPPANFNGPDFVDYTVTDGSLTDIGRLDITVTPVNDAPVAVDDAISVSEDVPFTSVVQLDANDTDLDADALTVVAGTFTTNAGGSITIAADGSYTYTPPANFNGADFVNYTVTDGVLTDVGRLDITVTPVNDRPVAVDDAISVIEDTPFTSAVQLDANDTVWTAMCSPWCPAHSPPMPAAASPLPLTAATATRRRRILTARTSSTTPSPTGRSPTWAGSRLPSPRSTMRRWRRTTPSACRKTRRSRQWCNWTPTTPTWTAMRSR